MTERGEQAVSRDSLALVWVFILLIMLTSWSHECDINERLDRLEKATGSKVQP